MNHVLATHCMGLDPINQLTLHCNKLYNSLSLWHTCANSTKLIEKYQYTSGPVRFKPALFKGQLQSCKEKIANCVLDINEDKIKGTMAVTEGTLMRS